MFTGQFRFLARTLCIYNKTQRNLYYMWGSEALACGWLERSMGERTIPTGEWHGAIMKYVNVIFLRG